VGSVIGMKS